jgi:hypothetical protein
MAITPKPDGFVALMAQAIQLPMEPYAVPVTTLMPPLVITVALMETTARLERPVRAALLSLVCQEVEAQRDPRKGQQHLLRQKLLLRQQSHCLQPLHRRPLRSPPPWLDISPIP